MNILSLVSLIPVSWLNIGKTDEDLLRLQKHNREQLIEHLSTLNDDAIVIKGRRKCIQKHSPADQADFRGSRYRGVSKNKGKWQVGLF